MCGVVAGGYTLDGRDISNQAVIQGRLLTNGVPTEGYVRLLDRSGEFTAEVNTDAEGNFRFFAREAVWTLRALAPQQTALEYTVGARLGEITEVELDLVAGSRVLATL